MADMYPHPTPARDANPRPERPPSDPSANACAGRVQIPAADWPTREAGEAVPGMKPIRTLPVTLDDAAPFVLAGLLALVAMTSLIADSCRGPEAARAAVPSCTCEVPR